MPTLEDKKKQLESLKNEIDQAQASLEGDFAKYAAQELGEEDENLFFEDKEKFILKLLQMQNEFLKDKLANKVQQAQDLHEEINTQQAQEQTQAIQQEFLAKHPEANMQELMAFYNQDIPPRFKAQLDQLEGLDFYEALYQAYQSFKSADSPPDAQQQPLPERLNGNASNPENTTTNDSVMNRF